MLRQARAILLAAAAACALAATPAISAGGFAEKASDSTVLMEKARAGGAPVIVELAAPELAAVEAAGSGEAAAQDAQREKAVATAVDGFVSRFFAGSEGAEASKRTVKKMRYAPLVAFVATPEELVKLGNDTAVVRVYADERVGLQLTEAVPLVGMPEAWKSKAKGKGVVVAVLDTGVQASHPFFGGRVVLQGCFSTSHSDGDGDVIGFCPNGESFQIGGEAGRNCPIAIGGCEHGTHVAGIIAGDNPDPDGLPPAGMAPQAGIVAVQVFSQDAKTKGITTQTSDYVAALEFLYSVRDRIDGGKRLAAINMSFGGNPSYKDPCANHPARPIIALLRKAGVASVIATGNDFKTGAVGAPACIQEAVRVGSTTKKDLISDFSDSAPFMDLFAPGSDILSSVPIDKYAHESGTSMATPMTAGAFAALASAVPDATVDQMLASLVATGKPIRDTRYGGTVIKPRIQVDKALADLKSRNNMLQASPREPILLGPAQAAKLKFSVTLSSTLGSTDWRLTSAPGWVIASRKRGEATEKGDRVGFRAKPLGDKVDERVGWLVFKTGKGKANTRLVRVEQRRLQSLLVVDVGKENPLGIMVANGVAKPSRFSVEVSTTWGSVPFKIDAPTWLTPSITSGTATKTKQTVTFKVNPPANLSEQKSGRVRFTQTDISYPAAGLNVVLVPTGSNKAEVAASSN